MCEACSVFAIHYKYMAEVLEKNIRSTEFIDHSFERQFYGACYGLRSKLARGPSLKYVIYTLYNVHTAHPEILEVRGDLSINVENKKSSRVYRQVGRK